MTALILFTREFVKELHAAAVRLDAESKAGIEASLLLQVIAGAVEAAAKKAFHL